METILILILVLFCLWCYFNWQHRWLYFYAWKFPGPFSLPYIGTVAVAVRFNKDALETTNKICKYQPPVYRIWIGNHLYIINTKPEDLEVLLNTFLEKSPDVYNVMNETIKNNLISAPVKIWRSHRKAISPSLNPKLIASFHSIFVKNCQTLVNKFETMCETELTDILPFIWKCNLDVALETLAGVDPSKLGDSPFIPIVERMEQIIIERIKTVWLVSDFAWKFSKLRVELLSVRKQIEDYLEKIIELKKEQMSETKNGPDDLRNQIFLQRLISLKDEKFTQTDLVDETLIMLIASSETSSVTITSVMLVLALYPEIQEKIYNDVSALLDYDEEDFIKNISKLDYLERVIKETMRFLPTVPILLRSIDSDINLGSHVFPAGSNLLVPIMHLHRRPDLWPNPAKFDPDRFLPDEVAKRHRCAYMPFSFGPRNCIGLNYGLVLTKIMVAYIVKNFTVRALNYGSLEELKFRYHIVLRPVEYRIMLSKRKR